jgi:hypothetical protein
VERTTYADIKQNTPQWNALRRGILTASVVGQIVTPTLKVAKNPASRMLANLLVSERITGRTEPTFVSEDMKRGHADEVTARRLYSLNHATVTQCGFMVLDTGGAGSIGYSPDGVVGADGLIEAKSRQPKHHLATILSDEVPAEYVAQVQTALLVSGREWIDYLSYCAGMPMWVKRVTPDEKWTDAILTAAAEFEKAATKMEADYAERVKGLTPTYRAGDRNPRDLF